MIQYRWENPVTKRYYRILLAKDLFGAWVMTRIWGGIGQATGRIMHLTCDSYEDAVDKINKLAKQRISRGYFSAGN